MKTSLRLALLLAATLPVALSANNSLPVTADQPVSVPDTANSLLLLGTGLIALAALKRNFFSKTQ